MCSFVTSGSRASALDLQLPTSRSLASTPRGPTSSCRVWRSLALVPESTVADILWHSTQSMTHHYSTAQIVELHGALEKIKADDGQWNKSLATLKMEQEGKRSFNPVP